MPVVLNHKVTAKLIIEGPECSHYVLGTSLDECGNESEWRVCRTHAVEASVADAEHSQAVVMEIDLTHSRRRKSSAVRLALRQKHSMIVHGFVVGKLTVGGDVEEIGSPCFLHESVSGCVSTFQDKRIGRGQLLGDSGNFLVGVRQVGAAIHERRVGETDEMLRGSASLEQRQPHRRAGGNGHGGPGDQEISPFIDQGRERNVVQHSVRNDGDSVVVLQFHAGVGEGLDQQRVKALQVRLRVLLVGLANGSAGFHDQVIQWAGIDGRLPVYTKATYKACGGRAQNVHRSVDGAKPVLRYE